jgi:hypothetical protein
MSIPGPVTICSSSKFYPAAQWLAGSLVAAGVTVHTPEFDYNETIVDVTPADKIRLTRRILSYIRASSLVYVVAEGGYTGAGVCIEVGYASALRKAVVLSEPAAEPAIAALTDAVIDIGEFSTRLFDLHGPLEAFRCLQRAMEAPD